MRAILVAFCLTLPLPALADPFYQQPKGHTEFLIRQPHLAFLGWATWRLDFDLLRQVNRHINTLMTYEHEERDVWGIGADCEDYAIRKLEALLRQGVPRGALRLAIARKRQAGHGVLVVRDLWVLDSLYDEPYRLDEVGHLQKPRPKIVAWETTNGHWSPASNFASLAEHFEMMRFQGSGP